MNLRVALRVIVLLVLAVSWSAAVAKDKHEEEKQAVLSFVVLKDVNGKPVRNASVVLRSVDEKGRQARGGVQLKTDAEGKTNIDGVPYGKLRVQVIAPGFQTYGEDFDIAQESQEIVVRLKRPAEQLSIYK